MQLFNGPPIGAQVLFVLRLRLLLDHAAHCLEDVGLISAHYDSIMVVISIKQLAVPSDEPLIYFLLPMQLKEALGMKQLSLLKLFFILLLSLGCTLFFVGKDATASCSLR